MPSDQLAVQLAGVAKVEWLDLVRSPAESALMRPLKAALDPGGMLSPGRVLP